MNELILLRLLADGSLDPSFGTAGALRRARRRLLRRHSARAHRRGRLSRRVGDGSGCRDHRRHGGRRTRCIVRGLRASRWSSRASGDTGRLPVARGPGRRQPARRRQLRLATVSRHACSRMARSIRPSHPTLRRRGIHGRCDLDCGGSRRQGPRRRIGVKGASIMRLQATGELDALFGDGGRTWIDLRLGIWIGTRRARPCSARRRRRTCGGDRPGSGPAVRDPAVCRTAAARARAS